MRWLQGLQAVTTFFQLSAPPRDKGDDMVAGQQVRPLLAAAVAAEMAVALEEQGVGQCRGQRFPAARIASAQLKDAADADRGTFAGEARVTAVKREMEVAKFAFYPSGCLAGDCILPGDPAAGPG